MTNDDLVLTYVLKPCSVWRCMNINIVILILNNYTMKIDYKHNTYICNYITVYYSVDCMCIVMCVSVTVIICIVLFNSLEASNSIQSFVHNPHYTIINYEETFRQDFLEILKH